LLFVWWVWSFSFLCFAPFSLLAVFWEASVFNQDVSKWNTGAVTTMEGSKCTLFLLLCGHGAFRCGVLSNINDNLRFVGSHVSHVLFFFPSVVGNGTLLLLFVWWVWSFFTLLHPSLFSCSVYSRICVQSGRVEMEYGGGDKYGKQ
jgi:surface protein